MGLQKTCRWTTPRCGGGLGGESSLRIFGWSCIRRTDHALNKGVDRWAAPCNNAVCVACQTVVVRP